MGVEDVMLGCPGGYGCASDMAHAHAPGRSLATDLLLAGIVMLTTCYIFDKILILTMVRNNFSGTTRTGSAHSTSTHRCAPRSKRINSRRLQQEARERQVMRS